MLGRIGEGSGINQGWEEYPRRRNESSEFQKLPVQTQEPGR